MPQVRSILLAAALIAAPLTWVGSTAPPAAALSNGLALTPPMGWNDWNAFGCDVSAQLVEQTADKLLASGLAADGYQYVNIDDCWMAPSRDSAGNLVPDPVKFPDGIKAVADYVHSKGLKLGIYETAGTNTCAGFPGSLGHETQDANTFASWGVDYLKYDNCNNQGVPSQQRYQAMGSALAATGRPMVYSLCSWGTEDVASWGGSVGNLWRTTGDISADYGSMLGNFHTNVALAGGAGPGAWNDPDMLEVGNGMSSVEDQTEFTLWAEMAAPLISGTDLRTASADTLRILGNRQVIAVDQDKLGRQGTEISSSGGLDVLAKPLSDGSVSVVLFNENAAPATISTTAAAAGVPAASGDGYALQDLWTGRTTASGGVISAVVPGHAAVMYKVAPAKRRLPPSTTLLTTLPSLGAGQSGTVYSYLTDNGVAAISDVTLGLHLPTGWTAKPLTATHFGKVAPGHMAISAFRLTASATLTEPIETAEIDGTETDHWSGGSETSTAPGSLRLVNPPQAPYKAFTSTTAQMGQLGNSVSIIGAGSDTWGSTDEYSSVYLPGAEHDGSTTVVEVTAQAATSVWAKAGIMVRDDITGAGTSPGYLILAVTPGKGYVLQWDSTGSGQLDSNSSASNSGLGTAAYPSWLKLVRSGSVFTGYYSTDDVTWTEVGTATVPGTHATQDVGTFMTAHNEGSGDSGEVDFKGFATS
ncbi:alpha-galactosidase [Catenulispora sp. MAP12-49]|uniref:NEW3 domain-containing protein n=1 Tax=Catenulispora sp. MAP12-49 TaxID=3156302 RepID=UPI003515FA6C